MTETTPLSPMQPIHGLSATLINKETSETVFQFESDKKSILIRLAYGYYHFTPSSLTDIEDKFCFEFLDIKSTFLILDCKPRTYADNKIDALILLYCSKYWDSITLSNEQGLADIVFDHAVPLAFTPKLYDQAINHINLLVTTGNLMILSRKQFLIVDPSLMKKNEILYRHRRLLRKNIDTKVTHLDNFDELLKHWKDFVVKRFNYIPDDEGLLMLKSIFNTQETNIVVYMDKEEYVSSNLRYIESTNKIIFDVIAPWSYQYSKLSPGLYSAVKNLLLAKDMGYRYSLCYGRYAYKNTILSQLPLVSP